MVIGWSKQFIQNYVVLTVKVAESEIVFATIFFRSIQRHVWELSHTYVDPPLKGRLYILWNNFQYVQICTRVLCMVSMYVHWYSYGSRVHKLGFDFLVDAYKSDDWCLQLMLSGLLVVCRWCLCNDWGDLVELFKFNGTEVCLIVWSVIGSKIYDWFNDL